MKRQIYYFRNYYLDFFNQQTGDVQEKFNWTLQLISELDRVPSKYLNHMEGTDGLYEIRVEVGSNIYRVFCFFDAGRLVILLNAFQKKSQKTPKNELELAKNLKKQYYAGKKSK